MTYTTDKEWSMVHTVSCEPNEAATFAHRSLNLQKENTSELFDVKKKHTTTGRELGTTQGQSNTCSKQGGYLTSSADRGQLDKHILRLLYINIEK